MPRCDIEALIHSGDQAAHYEAARIGGTVSYKARLPASIEKNARLLDEALAAITVCDPAIGSGAFPVGMMQEIVRARTALTPYFNDVHDRTPYHFKRHAIQNCLYGVDIDPGAVEIAKLRLWLSLVVDEEDARQIKPLPNLDFKVVVGNSLLGVEKTLFNEKLFERLEELKPKYFDETDGEKKRKYRQEIDQIIHQLTNGNETFDFEIYFSEVFHRRSGFDVVIGNPPYLNSRSMARDDALNRRAVRAAYSMAKGSWDLYVAFFERGFALRRPLGLLTFITPDKWISKPFGNELRRSATGDLRSILRAGRDVFESATVDAIVTIHGGGPSPRLQAYDYVGGRAALRGTVEKSSIEPPYRYDWIFSDQLPLLERIESASQRLEETGLCENSCATDDAYRLRAIIAEHPPASEPGRYLRVINTGTISKYAARWGRRQMVYLGARYLRPVVEREKFLKEFPNSYGLKSTRPKIIVKGLNLLDGCLDASGAVVPGIPTLIITAGGLQTLKTLLAAINCPVALFYIRQKYPGSSYNQGTTFTKEMLNSLPVPRGLASRAPELARAVDRVVEAKEADPDADTSELEREINEIVYQLYGLTPEEIAIIEGSTAPAPKPRKRRTRGRGE